MPGMTGFGPRPSAVTTSGLVLAEQVRLRALRGCRGVLGDCARRVSMQGLRQQHVADGGHGVPRHPHAVVHIVSGNVVHHQPEEWHERHWAAARTGLGPRRTGLDVAAQAAQSLGTTGPRSTYGEIDVDDTYVGGPEEGKRGRTSEKKSLVVVAIEKHGRAIGRIRLKRVKDVSAERLMNFTRETVEPGTTMHTAGRKGSAGLSAAGYTHRITVIRSGDEQAYEVMPPVHHTASLLKRWRLGTLQGGVQPQHLDTTSINIRFASTAADHTPVDCSFTVRINKLLPPPRHRTVP